MARFRRSSPLEQLPALLPALLAEVSLGRSQLIVDQLRGALQRGGAEEIVMITVPRESDSSGDWSGSGNADPAAVALAIVQPPSDAATLLHAGMVADRGAPDSERRLGQRLRSRLHRELTRRGVRFVQWATDPVTAPPKAAPAQRPEASAEQAVKEDEPAGEPSSTARWAEWMGLEPVATLRYLAGPLAELAQQRPSDRSLEKGGVELVPVDRHDPASFTRFARLVQRTYRETLDCEPLSRMRSAEQILSAYHHSRAFQHQRWYRVVPGGAAGGEAVGCLILAGHRDDGDSAGPDQPSAGSVAELVYMGVVPEARGRGLGRQLVAEAVNWAARWGAERLILAVDERNRPAIDAYAAAGLTPLLRETVWATSLPPGES